jgi:tRNA1(Val) A37 N6-methylase TrmN6
VTGDLTCDRFLDGRLRAHQPRHGFRSGVDAVFLAAAVDARAGQSVLELGCGVGVASLCLSRRVPGLTASAVEVQPGYADLARRNARENGITLQVVTADLRALPPDLLGRNFDHVFANPPYFDRAGGTRATDAGRERALAEDTPLQTWLDVATKRLKPGGYLTFIQKANRLPDLLNGMDRRLGSVVVRPLVARTGRRAELVIVAARKGGRGAFQLSAPLVMHQGDRHRRDEESYTPQIRAILRDACPLKMSD